MRKKHDDIHERDVTPKYWMGDPGARDDFGMPIRGEFIDGKLINQSSWAIMVPGSWRKHGVGRFGTGYGQKYRKQKDGRWLKVEG